MPIGDIIFLLLVVLAVSVFVVIALRSRRPDNVASAEHDSLPVNEDVWTSEQSRQCAITAGPPLSRHVRGW